MNINARPKLTITTPLICIALSCNPSQAQAKPFELMTRNPATNALPDGLYNSENPAVSPDGRFVVFESSQTNLLATTTNGSRQIYLFDRSSETLELISANTNGQEGNNSSYRPAISANGCKVVFHSDATNLVDTDLNGTSDIFLHDRCAPTLPYKQTRLISISSAAVPGNKASNNPDISQDGSTVVFESFADNLVAENVGSGSQIYLHDLNTGSTSRISTPITGDAGDGFSSAYPKISANGSRVAFWSISEALISHDVNKAWDIFVYDRNTGLISLVTNNINGVQRDQGNESFSRVVEPAISADGRYVSFATTANNLVPNDNNNAQDVFVKDTLSGSISRASITSSAADSNGDSPVGQGERAALSGNGEWVVFTTNAANLSSDTKTPKNILHNMLTNANIELAPYGSGYVGSRPAISGSADGLNGADAYGRFVAFFDGQALDPRFNKSGVFLLDRHSPPIADAGPDRIANEGSNVSLDGTASTVTDPYFPNPKPALSYLWTELDGPAVNLLGNRTATPSFASTTAGTYRFQLTVNDGIENSAPDTVLVQIGNQSINLPPIANAGPDAAGIKGKPVSLDGGASADPEGAQLSFRWSQTEGPASVALSSPIIQNPVFTPKLEGTYKFSLTVNDGSKESTEDLISIQVAASAITANPGTDRNAGIGDLVVLKANAVSSDPKTVLNKLKYSWQQTGGPTLWTKPKASPKTTFTPQLPGTYIFSLVAYDQRDRSSPAPVSITVNPSITLTEPAANTVWNTGKTALIKWTTSGINAKKALVIKASSDNGQTFYDLNKSIASAKGKYVFKVKPGRKSSSTLVSVCLMHPKNKKQSLVCGLSPQAFVTQ